MLKGYYALTLTYRQTEVQDLGYLMPKSETEAGLLRKLDAVKSALGWDELMYVATCNRVMYFFYSSAPIAASPAAELLTFLHSAHNFPITLPSKILFLSGGNAVRHLFEVSSSLDSMVLGEREIIKQLRMAFERAFAVGLAGDHIRLAMKHAVETGKSVMSNTGIGEKNTSVVSLAFANLMSSGIRPDSRLALIGAGQTNQLFGKFLIKYGFKNIAVCNRGLENGKALAEKLGGDFFPLSQIKNAVEGADAVVICTASSEPLLDQSHFPEAKPRLIIDLAVPANMAFCKRRFPHTQYVGMELLREMAGVHRQHRESARAKAESIIDMKVKIFKNAWHERQIERSLSHLPDEIKAVRDKAVQVVFEKEFAACPAATQELILEMLGYMEKKCIAIPIKTMKKMATDRIKATAAANQKKDLALPV